MTTGEDPSTNFIAFWLHRDEGWRTRTSRSPPSSSPKLMDDRSLNTPDLDRRFTIARNPYFALENKLLIVSERERERDPSNSVKIGNLWPCWLAFEASNWASEDYNMIWKKPIVSILITNLGGKTQFHLLVQNERYIRADSNSSWQWVQRWLKLKVIASHGQYSSHSVTNQVRRPWGLTKVKYSLVASSGGLVA